MMRLTFLLSDPAPSFRPASARAVPAMVAVLALLMLVGCATRQPPTETVGAEQLVRVAAFEKSRPTGVTVSPSNRVFVCFPAFTGHPDVSLVEVTDTDRTRLFPNDRWNNWDGQPGRSARTSFVSVQSVYADDKNRLWVLDPGSPYMKGVVDGAAKLVEIDLTLNRVVRVIGFEDDIAPEASYLNDVRVDTRTETAYITDSGLGAIIVIDLPTGHTRRLLTDHPSVKAEKGVVPRVEGQSFKVMGKALRVHSDGLALSPEGDWLYYHALTGRHLYRVPTDTLRDPSVTATDLTAAIEDLGETPLTDGMLMDRFGELYLTAIERNAIIMRRPSGEFVTLVQAPQLSWPDSVARSPDGHLYITTSMVHLLPRFEAKPPKDLPFGLYRIPLQ